MQIIYGNTKAISPSIRIMQRARKTANLVYVPRTRRTEASKNFVLHKSSHLVRNKLKWMLSLNPQHSNQIDSCNYYTYSTKDPNFLKNCNFAHFFYIIIEKFPPGFSDFFLSQIPIELSKFRSNVRNSGRTFKIPVERSKFRSNVGKNQNGKCDKRSKNEFPEFFVEANLIFDI